jgi:hypothetical protein
MVITNTLSRSDGMTVNFCLFLTQMFWRESTERERKRKKDWSRLHILRSNEGNKRKKRKKEQKLVHSSKDEGTKWIIPQESDDDSDLLNWSQKGFYHHFAMAM